MNLKKNNFNKLIDFHWVFIKKNPLLWILTSISAISQILLIIILEIIGKDINDYSLLLFLIPNILFVVLIIYLGYVLFQSNKDNSIDNKLLCSKCDKHYIKLARFTLMWIFLACIIFASNLSLLYFFITNQLMMAAAIFISNTFVTPFILLLVTILFSFLAIKTNKGVYIFLTILVCILTFGLSIFSRLFISEPKIEQDNYYKLVNNKNNYLVQNSESELDLNKQIKTNTFVPSEWFYSIYSLVFGISKNNSTSKLSIQSTILEQTNYDVINQPNLVMIRPNDINFLSLNNNEYINMIISNIQKVIIKHNLVKNDYLIDLTTNYINNQFEWNYFSNNYVRELLLDITGINTEFNQLFYLIKYHQLLNFDLQILFNSIKASFNEKVSELFSTLLTSNNAFYNLFKSNNEFNSTKIYPNNYVVNSFKPIIENDKKYLEQTLIKFNSNGVYYLSLNQTYKKLDITKLQAIDKSIIDEKTYYDYVNMMSLTYNSSFEFLKKLKIEIPDLMNYTLSPNFIDQSTIYKIYESKISENVYYSEMFLGLIIFANIISNVLFFTNIRRKE